MAEQQIRRLEFHNKLKTVCNHVYHDPPESVKLVYPCVVYSEGRRRIDNADNVHWRKTWGYDVTIISTDADEPLVEQVEDLFSMVSFTDAYTADNLHHWLYLIYF